MTARVTFPEACTTLPGSTSRKPTRPLERRGDVAVVDLNLVELHGSLVDLYHAFVLQHELFLVVQDLLGDSVARPCRFVAFQIHSAWPSKFSSRCKVPWACKSVALVRSRIDVNQGIAFMDRCPSLKCTATTSPFTWLVMESV